MEMGKAGRRARAVKPTAHATEATEVRAARAAPDTATRLSQSAAAHAWDRLVSQVRIPPAWRDRLALVGPPVVVALVLLLIARIFYVRYEYHDLTGFIGIGQGFAHLVGLPNAGESVLGNDGQYFYFLALRPDVIFSCHAYHPTNLCPMPVLRAERIFYPATVGILSLGQPQLLPVMMLLVNVAAILITVVLIGQMAREMGGSRWLGAAAGLYAGAGLALVIDVADPYGVMWVVVALYLARHNRVTLSALAVAAAMLTREQLIFLLPFFALPFVARAQWLAAARFLGVALAPFAAWQVILHAAYGEWPLLNSSTSGAPLVPIPFLGLWKEAGGPNFVLILLSVLLPILAAVAVSIVAIRRAGVRALLLDPWPAMVLFYCFLLSLTDKWQWMDIWAPTRLAMPALAIALIGTTTLPRSWRVGYAALLASTSLVMIAKNAHYLLH